MPLSAQAQTSLYIDDNHLSIMAECESGGARSMSLLEKVILKGCCVYVQLDRAASSVAESSIEFVS
jgi:hypothetical protein